MGPLGNPFVAHAFIWAPAWTETAIRDAIDRAAAIGFDGIAVPLRDPAAVPAEAVARWCAAAGIRPYATSGGRPDADISSADPAVAARGAERLALAIAKARDLGAAHLGGVLYGAMMKYPGRAAPGTRERAAATLAALAGRAAASGIVLALECVNRYESNLLNTAAQGRNFVAMVGAANVRLHLDTYHLNIEERDAAAAILDSAAELGFMEFGESHRGALGQGSVDIRGAVRALVAIGYRGPIGLEAFSTGVNDPTVGDLLSIWRDVYDDPDRLAREAKALLESEFAKART
ncbi:MAG: sugar phosphate isomerase/epimerase [Alphaproteobacteria bacterium]|nr:sugar phosphate isomerase/epimerase [Alphaproteobacteria bacterium]